jgi:two-component system, cell cycle sensor histidine kinase and response regulator CckA
MADPVKLGSFVSLRNLRLPSAWLAYGSAIVLTAIVLPIRFVFGLSPDQGSALTFFLLPIVLSAYLGGLGPGLLATFLSGGLADYFLFPPFHTVYVASRLHFLQLGALLVAGIVVSVLTDSLRRSVDRANLSESLLAGVVSSAMDAIITVNQQQHIVQFNSAAEKVFGCSADDAIGNHIDRFIPERYRTAHTLHIRDFGRTQETRRRAGALGRLTAIRSDGEEFPIEASISQTVVSGQPHFTVILRDITEQKRAEDARQRSEADFRILFEQAADGIFIADAQGHYLDVNLSGARMLGYSHDEICHLTIADVIAAEEIPKLPGAVARLATGNVERSDWRFRRKDGSFFDGEVIGTKLPDGRLQAFLRDVTERKRAEAALAASEGQLSSIVNNAPYAIYRTVVGGGGRFVFVNPAMVSMLGYSSAEEVLALNIERDVYKSTADRTNVITSMRSQGAYTNLELHWRKKNGQELIISSTGRLMRSEDGCEYFESIAEDVTERHSLERQLLQAQKMEAVGRLAGGISHDFNNILGVITGYCEIANDVLPPDHPVSNHLAQIKTAAMRAVNLTRQLLVFSRKQVVFPKVVDLNAVVLNLAKMLRLVIGEDIILSFKPGAPLGCIRADVGQIEQVLMNLVVNARDAMPDGGRITIETRDAELDGSYQAQHDASIPLGPYVMLSVSDSGCGMNEETKSHVFEPFFTTKDPGKGTGLGLSTVYGIVKQSGGFIWIYSEPGTGATFKVYFPCVEGLADKIDKSSEPETFGGSETILLAEDDPALRSLSRELLSAVGYKILEAESPEQAIETARDKSRPIHLLLTDVIMPGMGGVELSERLKTLRPGLKVIFMSGYSGDALGKKIALVPDMVLIEKPFSRSSLLTAVHKALRAQTL